MRRLQDAFGRGDVYELLRGAQLFRLQESAPEDFERAEALLRAAGCEIRDEWREAESRFAHLSDGNGAWHMSFQGKTGELRIVRDIASPVLDASEEEESVRPLITQGRLLYYAYDCGMLYLIRLTDGRFAVIDGGMAEYDEAEHFLELIEGQNVRSGAPEIAAWFITHAHGDHFSLFAELCERFSDRVKIDALVYNWAKPEYYLSSSDLTRFDRALDQHPEIAVIAPHTGQRFFLPGARFDVLYTHEDRTPDFLENFNDTSTVMRMEIAGRRVLWTGDCMRETADLLCREYPAQTLKCDYLQVAHHGYSGGSDALYRAADPAVLLWPCPDFWFYTQSKLECNRYLTDSPKIRAMFLGGRQEITFDPADLPAPADPYAEYDAKAPGDVLWEMDLKKRSIYALKMSAVTGGRTNYRSAALSFGNGALMMEAAEDQYSVCELLQPGMLRRADGYRLEMRLFAEKTGTAALFWNYEKPWEFDAERALGLPLQEGAESEIRLEVSLGHARLYQNGALICEKNEEKAAQRGLYLILKDVKITVRAARVMR